MSQPVLKDEYRLNARLRPAFILILPLAIPIGLAVVAFSNGWALALRAAGGTLLAFATNVGLMMALEQVVREQGKRKEPGLWTTWGGAPTTRMLRHRESELSTSVRRQRIREKLKDLVPTVRLPTKAKEAKAPQAADEAYEECVVYLRNATRDEKKFPLIYKENIQYGFARNLWAMRRAGIMVASVGTLLTGLLTWTAWHRGDSLWLIDGLALGVELMLLSGWVFRVTPAWVFIPARAYAERLFEACDSLKPETAAEMPATESK